MTFVMQNTAKINDKNQIKYLPKIRKIIPVNKNLEKSWRSIYKVWGRF